MVDDLTPTYDNLADALMDYHDKFCAAPCEVIAEMEEDCGAVFLKLVCDNHHQGGASFQHLTDHADHLR